MSMVNITTHVLPSGEGDVIKMHWYKLIALLYFIIHASLFIKRHNVMCQKYMLHITRHQGVQMLQLELKK